MDKSIPSGQLRNGGMRWRIPAPAPHLSCGRARAPSPRSARRFPSRPPYTHARTARRRRAPGTTRPRRWAGSVGGMGHRLADERAVVVLILDPRAVGLCPQQFAVPLAIYVGALDAHAVGFRQDHRALHQPVDARALDPLAVLQHHHPHPMRLPRGVARPSPRVPLGGRMG